MTGPHDSDADRPISVAELLARNGTIGAPVSARRRRRRGNSDAVSVAELTGEIPVIRDDEGRQDHDEAPPADGVDRPGGEPDQRDPEPDRPADPLRLDWTEPAPRWPASPPQPERRPGPQRSHYPRPLRKADGSDAEQMRPDPAEDYADVELDVMGTDVYDVDLPTEDSAYVRSFLRPRTLFGKARGRSGPDGADAADELDDIEEIDEIVDGGDALPIDAAVGEFDDDDDIEADLTGDVAAAPGGFRGSLAVVAQSILAVAFGAGVFRAFEELWRWNLVVALALTAIVTLGLVTAVQVVRKPADTASTLIAVAVGLLVTLGPYALLQLQSG